VNSQHLNDLSKQIYSPVPFWFLNGPVEEWHVVRELDMMAEKGVGDVIVHPRYGLRVDYLSEGWFQIFGWCVREAKKHGMRLWIYDEMNWPSGTANKSVMKVDPAYRGKYLAVEQVRREELDAASFEPGLVVVAANIEGDSVTKTKLIEDQSAISALGPNWRIFNCRLCFDKYYVDTLSFEAMNCFTRLTHDAYYARFGDEFGETIRAAFTDEPSIYWVSVGYDDWNLPYTDDFFQTFEQRRGYDPRPMIPYLFYPGRDASTGLSMMAFRADYWEHAGHLFNERYHGTLGSWCREHGIIYTGHGHHEEPLRYQIRFSGDLYDGLRTMDVPGVDHLGKQTLGNPFINIVGHKICTSGAHVTGKARAMSESFGVMEWDTTYAHLKRVVDWQYALGINMLVPHAIYHTISGMTKRECPPSFFYQSPHWDDFGEFGRYVRNLEGMLTEGRHTCKVAVMLPLTGLWASYQSDRKTAEFEHTDNFLSSLCLELIKNQIDFDVLDFRALCDATLDDGLLKIADEEYSVLLAPSTPYLRQEEAARLTAIASAGVSTTFFHKSMEPGEQNIPQAIAGAAFVRTEELVSFVDVLKRQVNHDIQITGGGADDIMAYRWEKQGRKITFLVNRSDKHRKVTAMIKDYPDAAIYDPETDRYAKLEGRRAGTKLQAQLRFEPNQSYFIVSNAPDAKPAGETHGEPTPIALGDLRVDIPYNVASIYHFQYSREEGTENSEGVDVRTNPRNMICDWAPSDPHYEQYAGVYEAEVGIDCDPSAIRMMVDSDFAECEVYVNYELVRLLPCCGNSGECAPTGGADTSFPRHRPFLTDFGDLCAEVGHLLKSGANRLKVVSPTKLSEPLRLVGPFRVRAEGTTVQLTEGDPAEVDPFRLEFEYPFYSGTIRYYTEFELATGYPSLILDLHDVRDAAEVWVNGRLAGKRLWAPFAFEITPLAERGRNTLEIRVRNNMTNLICGSPRPLGLRSAPTLAGAG